MLKSFARVGLLALAAVVCTQSDASAAVHMPGSAAMLTVDSKALPVTFWSHPYPYRYVPSRRCPLVRVETPYGWYRDRVCVSSGGPILRRAY
ncbi:hypothetical protein ABIA99_002454 [Bradyrhizobium sp. LB12.1]